MLTNPQPLGMAVTIVFVLLGILISLVLPVAVNTLRRATVSLETATEHPPSLGARLAEAWKRYGGNRYLAIILAASLVAVVLVSLLGLTFYTARDAALAGFAWESLVSKLMGVRRQSGNDIT